MREDLATQAELHKLAVVLGVAPDRVGFAASLTAAELRELRESVSHALYAEHRAAYQRIAAASKLLPAALTTRVALRAFPPVLAAGVAAELPADRAADLAARLPIGYLADVCVEIDPDKVAPLLTRLPRQRVHAVAGELVARGAYSTFARLLDVADDGTVRTVAATIRSDEALLRIAFYAESAPRLSSAIGALSESRLRSLVHNALAGGSELLAAWLSMMSRVDDRLRTRLAGLAADAEQDALAALVHFAISEGAVVELLRVVGALDEPARAKVAGLPVLGEPGVVAELVEIAAEHDLVGSVLPVLPHLPQERSRQVAELAAELDQTSLRVVLDTAHRTQRWPALLRLAGYLDGASAAAVRAALDASAEEVRAGLLHAAREQGR